MSNNNELIKKLLNQASKVMESLEELEDSRSDETEYSCDNCKAFCDEEKCCEEHSVSWADEPVDDEEDIVYLSLKEYEELIEIKGRYLELKESLANRPINIYPNITSDKKLDPETYKITCSDATTKSSLNFDWLNDLNGHIPTIY